MTARCKGIVHTIILVGLIHSAIRSHAQFEEPDLQKWAIELNKKGKDGNERYRSIDSILQNLDSARTFEFLNKLADKGKKDYYFQARFNCLKAHLILFTGQYQNQIRPDVFRRKGEIKAMLVYAMDQAYQSEDGYLVAFVSAEYSKIMIQFGEIGLAVM